MKSLKLIVRLMFLPWILLHRFLSSKTVFLILQCIGTLLVGLICGGILFWIYASWGIYAAALHFLIGVCCSYGVYWLNRKWEIPKDAYFELNLYLAGLGIWPLYVGIAIVLTIVNIAFACLYGLYFWAYDKE